jgi:hypothetical protein
MRLRITATTLAVLGVVLLAPQAVLGQTTTVNVQQLACMTVEEHPLVEATVTNNVPDTATRIYFRRLHEIVEDFYWVEMVPTGNGRYWAALPKPEDEMNERFDLEERLREGREQDNHPWGAWWKEKEQSADRDPNQDLPDEEIRERASVGKRVDRDWMDSMSIEELERWLMRQEYEPSEYYAAVVGPNNRVVAVSPVRVTSVLEKKDCPVPRMTPAQEGFSRNLTVGETAPWQRERERVFHWLCDGVVTRIDERGIWREDDVCRACVVAWWKKNEFLIPASIGAIGGVVGILIDDDDEPATSPVRP